MTRRNIKDDVAKFLGHPPYDDGSNIVRGDGYFSNDCRNRYGLKWIQAIADAKRDVDVASSVLLSSSGQQGAAMNGPT